MGQLRKNVHPLWGKAPVNPLLFLKRPHIYYVFSCFYDPYSSQILLLSVSLSLAQVAGTGSPEGSSEEIHRVYSLWATFIGLYIANYLAERSSA